MTSTPKFSIEIFPTNSEAAQAQLFNTIKQFESTVDLQFISITFGANGSSQQRSVDLIKKLHQQVQTPLMPHLTCINQTPATIDALVRQYQQLGINQFMALRGDKPELNCQTAHPYAQGLVKQIRAMNQSSQLYVACYPEKHPQAQSLEEDLAYLKEKFLAGANYAVSQFFFDVPTFLRFRDQAAKYNLDDQLIAGIFPITSYATLNNFIKLSKSYIPSKLKTKIEAVKTDEQALKSLSIDIAITQISQLHQAGVKQFHLYCLNHLSPSLEVCQHFKCRSSDLV